MEEVLSHPSGWMVWKGPWGLCVGKLTSDGPELQEGQGSPVSPQGLHQSNEDAP